MGSLWKRGRQSVSPETLSHQSRPQVERRSDSQEGVRKTQQRWVREVTEGSGRVGNLRHPRKPGPCKDWTLDGTSPVPGK